jgi:hypothetical protein
MPRSRHRQWGSSPTIAIALCLAAPALAMENLYPFETLGQSPDYRAHPRSFAEYRQIVSGLVDPFGDPFGICRNAGHLDQCVWKINGHQYPPPPEFVALIKRLEEGRPLLHWGPEREDPPPNGRPRSPNAVKLRGTAPRTGCSIDLE